MTPSRPTAQRLVQLRPWLPELMEAIQNCSPYSSPISMNPKGQKGRKDGKKEVMKYREMGRRSGGWGPTLQHCLLFCGVKGGNKILPL